MTTACAVAQESYRIRMDIGIKSDNGHVLLRAREYTTTITPPVQKYTTHAAIMTRCENLALAEYAKQFETQMDGDMTIQRLLRGKDWSFFYKVNTFKKE